MSRVALSAALLLPCCSALAHLNHVQFATVEERGGRMVVRYRMSADMFMSNLEAGVKAGVIAPKVSRLPIDQMIALYFKQHLLVSSGGGRRAADSVAFQFDEKNGDWIADFQFDVPSEDQATLFCDAFLENNPNTQTLARINWRGENAVFHFRKGNTEYALGHKVENAARSSDAAARSGAALFVDGFAEGLKSYGLLVLGVAIFLLLRMKLKFWTAAADFLACVLLTVFLCAMKTLEQAPNLAGWLMGFLAVVFTAQELGLSCAGLFRKRIQ